MIPSRRAADADDDDKSDGRGMDDDDDGVSSVTAAMSTHRSLSLPAPVRDSVRDHEKTVSSSLIPGRVTDLDRVLSRALFSPLFQHQLSRHDYVPRETLAYDLPYVYALANAVSNHSKPKTLLVWFLSFSSSLCPPLPLLPPPPPLHRFIPPHLPSSASHTSPFCRLFFGKKIDWKQPNRYIPYTPVISSDETGVYELIFSPDDKSKPDLVVYLGEGLIKTRIDSYGRDGDTNNNTTFSM
jgi:hypothetical protein